MEITEFEWLDPERVDAVGSPANGTPWLLVKSAEEDEPVLSEDGMVKYVSAAARRKFARSGVAMSNGDFPIPDEGHLKSAIGRLGNYHGDKAKAKRHIIKRARALGLTHLLPADWGVSKDMDTQAEDEDVSFPSPEATQGQTREMHPEAGPKSGDVSQDGGDPPSSRYTRSPLDLQHGDGLGDTAPSKSVPKAQALGQTQALSRKELTEGENQDFAAGGHPEADMTGDKAPNGEAEAHAAEDEGESQTRANERKAGPANSDQMRRQNAQSQKAKRRVEGDNPEDTQPHSAQWEGKDAALAEGAHQLLAQAMELVQQFESREKAEIRSKKAIKAHYPDIRRAAKLLTGLANGKTETGPATKEIEDMTQEELIQLLDARDAAKAKAQRKAETKKARKAQREIEGESGDAQARKAAKAAKKAAKAAGAAFDTDKLAKGLTEALAQAVRPLEDRLANVENQPVRAIPMANAAGLGSATAPRGTYDASAFKALEDRVAAAQTPAERQRAGAELLKAKMIATERLREAQGKTGQPVPLLSR